MADYYEAGTVVPFIPETPRLRSLLKMLFGLNEEAVAVEVQFEAEHPELHGKPFREIAEAMGREGMTPVSLTEEEEFLYPWVSRAIRDAESDVLLQMVDGYYLSAVELEWFENEGKPSLYLYFSDGFPDGFCEFLQMLLRFLKEVEGVEVPFLVIEGAVTCSKMRPGSHGGFAKIVKVDSIEDMSTGGWIYRRLGDVTV